MIIPDEAMSNSIKSDQNGIESNLFYKTFFECREIKSDQNGIES